MSKPLRAGLIGCGGVAGAHMRAYRQLEGVEVAAAAEIIPDRLRTFGEAWGIEKLYPDYEVMLEREKLDIVSVCTPPFAHCAPTIAAAEAGVRGIFCEKPMAMNLAEADRMLEACERSGTRLQIDHIYRFERNFRQAKAMVEAGVIGDLLVISGKCVGPPRSPEGYAGQYRLNGGGWMMAQGTHLFDLFRFYAGDPVWCLANVERWRPDVDIEDAATGLFGLQSGVKAFFEVSGNRRDRSFAFMAELEGAKGRLHISDGVDRLHFYHWTGGHPPDEWRPVETVEADPIADVLQDILNAVMDDREPASNGREGRAALEMIMAVFESQRQGVARIDFPLAIGENPLALMNEAGTLSTLGKEPIR